MKPNVFCVKTVEHKLIYLKTPNEWRLYDLRNDHNELHNIYDENDVTSKELKKMGSGADVVSIGELLKAIKAGISNKKIVFSGVGKTEEEIVMAIRKKVLLINVESENEVNLINKIAKRNSKKVSVGIRLNPNITGKTHEKISTGGKDE